MTNLPALADKRLVEKMVAMVLNRQFLNQIWSRKQALKLVNKLSEVVLQHNVLSQTNLSALADQRLVEKMVARVCNRQFLDQIWLKKQALELGIN